MGKNKAEKVHTDTPLMIQYNEIKSKHPDAILLFRVGDFYETFGGDAIKASSILGITLTKRSNIELAGFPYHSLNTYLPKLVNAGERIAICEQLEDPKTTKKIVKRGITELITPGVTYNDNTVSYNEDNWLASVFFGKKDIGIAFLDITTGKFQCTEGSAEFIEKLLVNYKPKEILFQKGCKEQFETIFGKSYYLYPLERWNFSETTTTEKLQKQFSVNSLKGFGVDHIKNGSIAAGAILYYLEFTEHHKTAHIQNLRRIDKDKNVWLDKYSLRNLEIISSTVEGGATLLKTIDYTKSAMGARNLRRWISAPIKSIKDINRRHNIVEYFLTNIHVTSELRDLLVEVGDLERLSAKIATTRINPREVVQLKNSFRAIEHIKTLFKGLTPIFMKWSNQLGDFTPLITLIEDTIIEEPPTLIQKGGVIAVDVSEELDSLRRLSLGGKEYLSTIIKREIEKTGITSLKISFNNVFGYYIEVRNAHKDKVPSEWIRKQTLSNAERYITEELKEYEQKILSAEGKIQVIETIIYDNLIETLSNYISAIQSCAEQIGVIDTLQSFAYVSMERKYVRPILSDDSKLDIKNGRHAVIESIMSVGEHYTPNDVYLDNTDQQIIIITGPNMSGKSALLRQTGLIVLMAQMGCFVPAESAHIGIVDKVFTRVGASDNISKGESTFMVEMLETATILNNVTDRSLVLLDEIGRGTSTYDGISIAWAIVEYLHQTKGCKAKTLFATHYHELNDMEALYSGIKNYNVQVKEMNNQVLFLRKLVRGGTEHSFGIHVAKMAAMPKSVVNRANEILILLEAKNKQATTSGDDIDIKLFREFKGVENYSDGIQLSMFAPEDPALHEVKKKINAIDIDNMRPIEALQLLCDIKTLLKDQ